MNKILITGCMVLTAFAAIAMPNKKELAKAQRLVEDVTSADLKALKAGKMTAKEVADNHMVLAEKAENEAQRYLLLQGAFKLYARDGAYDDAAKALSVMDRNIDEIPPELIIEIVSKEMRRVAGKKAPHVLSIFKQAQRLVRFKNEAESAGRILKSKPNDIMANIKCGEYYSLRGDWDKAIKYYVKAGTKEIANVAQLELNPGEETLRIADFWWDYHLSGDKSGDIAPCFRAHATKWYRRSIDQGLVGGLLKTRAMQRIEEATSAADIQMAMRHECDAQTLIINIGNGERLEFVNCPAGTFERDGNRITISRPFYIMKFPLTLGQWGALVDGRIDKFAGKYSMGLGGKDCAFPGASYMRAMFLSSLLMKKYSPQIPESGYVFRLPSAAEYDWALRAGVGRIEQCYIGFNHVIGNEYVPGQNDRVELLKKAGVKYEEKDVGDLIHKTVMKVGTKKPNRLGLYDMLGNGDAILMDTFEPGSQDEKMVRVGMDPFTHSVSTSAHYKVWWQFGCDSTGGWSHPCNKLWGQERQSMRLVIGPDLVSEWLTKHKSKSVKPGDVSGHEKKK